MGIDLEREPYTPIANRVWMCDYERIEDHGAYRDVIIRLELMTASVLGLKGVTDFVDVEQGQARVEFEYRGDRIRWDLAVEDDWLDPTVVVRYDALLREAGSSLRIYPNNTDYGQSALFGAFTQEEKRRFDKLSKIRLTPIDEGLTKCCS